VKADSILGRLLSTTPERRTEFVETNTDLEFTYKEVAVKGQTQAPESGEVEVEHHYIAFVRSRTGHIYELNGDRAGPFDLGELKEDDLLSEGAIQVVRKFIEDLDVSGVGFGLMALAPAIF
jgi:ubiquitin carboxyl-terminal hydrolase L3